MTESESVALPLGDTPIYVLNDSALLLYHLMPGLSILMHIFFYFNIVAQFLSFSGTLFLPLPKNAYKRTGSPGVRGFLLFYKG